MKLRLLAATAALVFVGAAGEAASQRQANKATTPQPPVWQRLERFSDDAEFLRYVREVRRLNGRGYDRFEDSLAVTGAPPPPAPPPPPPPPPSAAPSPSAPAEMSAGASQPSAGEPSSITNVQTQGVDEGGIVKQIGRFLIVLQDGRLFVVNTRPGDAPGLQLASRTNVYRSPNADTWYDELLTSGNRILVAGYSYREQASEITVLTINDAGQLTREATYYISSNDYYDIENYATRLVNGNLVIYTPLDISNVNPRVRMRWPVVRRWLRDGERSAVTTEGRSLFDGNDIYKPVQRTLQPMVHSVSVCPLGDLSAGDELDCRTTAFVGGGQREFFVSTSDIYLWVNPMPWDGVLNRDCSRVGASAASLPATVYQVPLSGETPRALHARGQPTNQLALDASAEEFRALLTWNVGPCAQGGPAHVRYFRAPMSAFRSAPIEARPSYFAAAPSPGVSRYEVHFTRTHVVYGGREGWNSYPPEPGATLPPSRVVALRLERPTDAAQVPAPHNIIRLERAGNNAVLTGYRTDRGLSVSLLDLDGPPRIVSTQVLDGRYESEGRSHAFNALVGPDDAGLMGLPTVTRTWEGGRWWFRSRASDVSYLTVNSAGRLGWAGQLEARQDAQHPDYRCEVSCVDWYGNTRALFIGNRVFALSATELIEGALANGRIRETRRLNLSAPAPRS
ncbi:MAG: beta-propeller domain-containing protein [Caulobacteraceae bacterium]